MSIFTEIAAAPLNSFVMFLNTALWIYMWNRRMGYEDVALSYRKVMLEKQYYRIITATFSHLDFMHIAFNMATLYSVGVLEAVLGARWYFETTFLLLATKAAMWMGITHVLVTKFGRLSHAEASAVGYSGILFGWITLFSLYEPTYKFTLLGFGLPVSIAPFIQLAITHFLIPRASLMGHLSGILGGYLVGWGLFDWLRGYWTVVSCLWFGLLCVLSLRANSAIPGRAGNLIARWIYVSPEYCQTTMLSSLADHSGEAFGTSVRRMLVDGVLRVVRPVAAVDIIDLPGPQHDAASAAPAYYPAPGSGSAEAPGTSRRPSIPGGSAGAPGTSAGAGAGAVPVRLPTAGPESGPRGGSPLRGVEIEMPTRSSSTAVPTAGARSSLGRVASGATGGRRDQADAGSSGLASADGADEDAADLEAGRPLMAARAGPGPTSSASSGEVALGSSFGRSADGAHAPGRPRRQPSNRRVPSPSRTGGLMGVYSRAEAALQSLGVIRGGRVSSTLARPVPAPEQGSQGAGQASPARNRGPGQASQTRRAAPADDDEEGEGADEERRRLI